jgi:hypothetical protein
VKEQPYVGHYIFSTNSTRISDPFVATIVASYYEVNPGKVANISNAVWVTGDSKELTGWKIEWNSLHCVNSKYIVGPATGLMKELL